jgi:phosphatidylglycerophosphatase A
MNISDKTYCRVASLFGVGRSPIMPGTAGCLVALPFYIFIPNLGFFAFVALSLTTIAFLVSGPAEKAYGSKDPKFIVIDDFAGQLVTFLFIPFSWKLVLIGFFLFRMFDMLKIYPANEAEKYPGAAGVVGDDIIAGIYANIVLQIALRFVPL